MRRASVVGCSSRLTPSRTPCRACSRCCSPSASPCARSPGGSLHDRLRPPASPCSSTLLPSGLAVAAPWERLPTGAAGAAAAARHRAVGLARRSRTRGRSRGADRAPGVLAGPPAGGAAPWSPSWPAWCWSAIPSLSDVGLDRGNLAGATLVPLVAAWAAARASRRLRAGPRRSSTRPTGTRPSSVGAMELIEHQRRVSDAILDTVDVGLVLLDRTGRYQAMNRRHRTSCGWPSPRGTRGRAGQLGWSSARTAPPC